MSGAKVPPKEAIWALVLPGAHRTGNVPFFTHSHTSHLSSPDGRPGGFVPTASPVGTAGDLVHLTGTILV